MGSRPDGGLVMAFWDAWFSRKNNTKEVAKKRLKLLLIHDQVDLTPSQMSEMKAEIVEVIERYLSVVPNDTHLVLNRFEKQIQLVGSVPLEERPHKKAQ